MHFCKVILFIICLIISFFAFSGNLWIDGQKMDDNPLHLIKIFTSPFGFIYNFIPLNKAVFFLAPFLVFFLPLNWKGILAFLTCFLLAIIITRFDYSRPTPEIMGWQAYGDFNETFCYPSNDAWGISLHTCFCNSTNSVRRWVSPPFWAERLNFKICSRYNDSDGAIALILLYGYNYNYTIPPASCIAGSLPLYGQGYFGVGSSTYGDCFGNSNLIIVREVFFS